MIISGTLFSLSLVHHFHGRLQTELISRTAWWQYLVAGCFIGITLRFCQLFFNSLAAAFSFGFLSSCLLGWIWFTWSWYRQHPFPKHWPLRLWGWCHSRSWGRLCMGRLCTRQWILTSSFKEIALKMQTNNFLGKKCQKMLPRIR